MDLTSKQVGLLLANHPKLEISPEIIDRFIENKINGWVFMDLNDEDLKSGLGVTEFGVRRGILKVIEDIRKNGLPEGILCNGFGIGKNEGKQSNEDKDNSEDKGDVFATETTPNSPLKRELKIQTSQEAATIGEPATMTVRQKTMTKHATTETQSQRRMEDTRMTVNTATSPIAFHGDDTDEEMPGPQSSAVSQKDDLTSNKVDKAHQSQGVSLDVSPDCSSIDSTPSYVLHETETPTYNVQGAATPYERMRLELERAFQTLSLRSVDIMSDFDLGTTNSDIQTDTDGSSWNVVDEIVEGTVNNLSSIVHFLREKSVSKLKRTSRPIVGLEEDDMDISDAEGDVLKTASRPKKRKVEPTPKQPVEIKRKRIVLPVTGNRVVVNRRSNMFGPTYDEQNIELVSFLCDALKEHQVDGVRFLWRRLMHESFFEDEKNAKSGDLEDSGDVDSEDEETRKISGAILAHPCGLGKTLTVIAFLHSLCKAHKRRHPSLPTKFRRRKGKPLRILMVLPSWIVKNCENEFYKWLGSKEVARTFGAPILTIGELDSLEDRFRVLQHFNKGGVLLMSYKLFTMLSLSSSKYWSSRGTFTHKRELVHILTHSPDIVICDEAHRVKDPNTVTTRALKSVRTKRRVALTGTPLQNNLIEYYSMIEWVAPDFLGDLSAFKQQFAQPIQSGLFSDATDAERKKMIVQMGVLDQWIRPIVHRIDSSQLQQILPSNASKFEFTIRHTLSELQHSIYQKFLELYALDSSNDGNVLFNDSMITHLLTHPAIFAKTLSGKINEWSRALGDGNTLSEPTAVNNREPIENGARDEIEEDQNEDRDEEELIASSPEKLDFVIVSQYQSLLQKATADISNLDDPSYSPKISILLDLVNMSLSFGDKVLVFSRWHNTLDYLESLFRRLQKEVYRIDGKVNMRNRPPIVDQFERATNPAIMLLSIAACGEGINIPAANRVIIVESGWNPTRDEQAIGRAYRLGQEKPVFVYRMIADGTIECKKSNINTVKTALSLAVVDNRRSEGDLVMKSSVRGFYSAPEQNLRCLSDDTELLKSAVLIAQEDPVLTFAISRHGNTISSVKTKEQELTELQLEQDEKQLVKQGVKAKRSEHLERLRIKAQKQADKPGQEVD